jgi:hypothetical protein
MIQPDTPTLPIAAVPWITYSGSFQADLLQWDDSLIIENCINNDKNMPLTRLSCFWKKSMG